MSQLAWFSREKNAHTYNLWL